MTPCEIAAALHRLADELPPLMSGPLGADVLPLIRVTVRPPQGDPLVLVCGVEPLEDADEPATDGLPSPGEIREAIHYWQVQDAGSEASDQGARTMADLLRRFLSSCARVGARL